MPSSAEARRTPPDAARLRAVRVVLAGALAAGTLLSIPLWLGTRDFPLFPRLPFVPSLPAPFDRVALAILWGLLAGIAVRQRPRFEIVALTTLVGLLILEDHTRCQPWVYQYVLMLLVTLPAESAAAQASQVSALRLMMAALYVWSGLQKQNLMFFADTAPWLIEPVAWHLPAVAGPMLDLARYAFPTIESLIGIGLLVPRLRRPAVVLGLLMHVFILYAIGPLGHHVNTVVWPWNLAMMALLVVLFADGAEAPLLAPWSPRAGRFPRLAGVVAFAVLPALNFVGLWSSDLSWSLYAGMMLEMDVNIDAAALPCLPPEVRRRVKTVDGEHVLSVVEWAVDAMNVPPYPERWVYGRVRDLLCRCDPHHDLMSFDVWDTFRWHLPMPLERHRCGEAPAGL